MGNLYDNAKTINLIFTKCPFQAADEGGSGENVWLGNARDDFNDKFLPLKNDMLKIVRAARNLEDAKVAYDEHCRLYEDYLVKKAIYDQACADYNMYGWGEEEAYSKEAARRARDNARRIMDNAKTQVDMQKNLIRGLLNFVGQ